MFVVYDDQGRARGRAKYSGPAITEALKKAFRGIHPKDMGRTWSDLKTRGWQLHEHRQPDSAGGSL